MPGSCTLYLPMAISHFKSFGLSNKQVIPGINDFGFYGQEQAQTEEQSQTITSKNRMATVTIYLYVYI